MKILFITFIVVNILLINSCATYENTMYNKRVNDFLEVSLDTPISSSVENPEQKFLKLFGDFKQGAKSDIIRDLYAEKFYFNDTFKTFTNINDLVAYMHETADNVTVTTVEILDISKSESDYYLRWVMHMKFTAKGRAVDSKSVGMTQIRFNDQGKVILHQDYWDGAEGFYEHLPLVGYIVRKIKSSL